MPQAVAVVGAGAAGGAGVGAGGGRLQQDAAVAVAGRGLEAGEELLGRGFAPRAGAGAAAPAAAAAPLGDVLVQQGAQVLGLGDVLVQQGAQVLGLGLGGGGQEDEGLDGERGGSLGLGVAWHRRSPGTRS